jgi:hypothetical protein
MKPRRLQVRIIDRGDRFTALICRADTPASMQELFALASTSGRTEHQAKSLLARLAAGLTKNLREITNDDKATHRSRKRRKGR